MPDINPLFLSRARPCGKAPEWIVHWYGPDPPLAERVALYGTSSVPTGNPLIVIASFDRGTIVTSENAKLSNWAALVAVIITFVGDATVGATNKPALEIIPALADQLTAVLLVEVSVAVNCCFPPDTTVKVAGVTLTRTFALFD